MRTSTVTDHSHVPRQRSPTRRHPQNTTIMTVMPSQAPQFQSPFQYIIGVSSDHLYDTLSYFECAPAGNATDRAQGHW